MIIYESEKFWMEMYNYDIYIIINIHIKETGEIKQFSNYIEYKYKNKDYPGKYKKLNDLYAMQRAIKKAIELEKNGVF